MEIELKRIAYNPRLDENAFAANLFIDGVKAATVNKRDGNTQYFPVDAETTELVAKAEEYMKKLPAEKKVVDGKEESVKRTLADRIDNLFADHLAGIERKKFDKKVDLLAKRNIVIGEPGRYMRSHAMKAPIDVLVQGSGKDLVTETLTKKVLPTMSDREKILNKNIPEEIFKEAGLDDKQFIKAELSADTKKTATKNQGVKP